MEPTCSGAAISTVRATAAGVDTTFEVWKWQAGEGVRRSTCVENVDLGVREEDNAATGT